MLLSCFIARSTVEYRVMGGLLSLFSSILLQIYDYKLQTCAIALSPRIFEILLIRASGESASHHVLILFRCTRKKMKILKNWWFFHHVNYLNLITKLNYHAFELKLTGSETRHVEPQKLLSIFPRLQIKTWP